MAQQLQARRRLPRLRQSESLAAIISQSGALPEEQVWSIVDELLSRLESLHSQGKCQRTLSLSTIGVDASGGLEIAGNDSSLSISDLVRLHAPLPSCLRQEFDLVISQSITDATRTLSHSGFSGGGAALDLFQVAVITIRLIFDVDGEKFLASPHLHETLAPELYRILRGVLAGDSQIGFSAANFRNALPGASVQAVDSEYLSRDSGAECYGETIGQNQAEESSIEAGVFENPEPRTSSESTSGSIDAKLYSGDIQIKGRLSSAQVETRSISDGNFLLERSPNLRTRIFFGIAILFLLVIAILLVAVVFITRF